MLVSTNAIVLRRFVYQESGIIAEIFSESDGLISVIAKGARQNKKALGILEPLNIIFVTFYKKSTKDLYLLAKYETISSFYKLLSSFEKLVCGLMVAESIFKTQVNGIQNQKLFHKAVDTIESLKNFEFDPFILFVQFMLFLNADLGFQLNLTNKLIILGKKKVPFDLSKGTISLTGESKNIFWLSTDALKLLSVSTKIEKYPIHKLNIELTKEIVEFFESYLSLHLEKTISFQSFSFLSQ